MAEELRVEVIDVYKVFGSIEALRGVTWRVEGTGIHSVLGPNGAGKTTLLKLVAGVYRPSRGVVKVLGKDPWRREEVLQSVSSYFEDAEAPPWLRGVEFLELVSSRLEVPWDRIESVATALGVDRFWKKRIRECSVGMRKRLMLTAALARDALIYVLDEPFAALDREGIEVVSSIIAEVSRRSMVLVASHIPAPILEESRSLIVLFNGEKVFDSSTHRGLYRVVCEYDSIDSLSKALKRALSRGLEIVSVSTNRIEILTRDPATSLGSECVSKLSIFDTYRALLEGP